MDDQARRCRPGRGEDRALVVSWGDRTVVVVADGAGGVSGGIKAAEAVCAAVVEQIRQAVHVDWIRCLSEIDHDIVSVGLAAAVVVEIGRDGYVIGASVGDCGAWVIEDGSLQDLTSGQVRKPLLGEGRAIPVGFEACLDKGSLLVATDGLWKYLAKSSIREVVTLRSLRGDFRGSRGGRAFA